MPSVSDWPSSCWPIHSNPSRRRVVAGLACGLGALMCSGIGLVMVGTVGMALLIRQGWRAGLLNTAPLIAVYGLWWSTYGHDDRSQPTGSLRQLFDFVVTGVRAVGSSAGQNPLSIVAMVAVTVAGLGLRTWSVGRSPARLRRQLGIPTALAVGAVTVFLATGLARVAVFGPSFATGGRYRYVAVALLAPVLAVGADAVVHRWRVATAPVLLLLAAGVPANVADIQVLRDPDVSPAIVLAVANWPTITKVPASTAPFPERLPTAFITAGWLRAGVESGRIPTLDRRLAPSVEVDVISRLALREGPTRPGLTNCVPLTTERTIRLNRGGAVGFSGVLVVNVEGPSGKRSRDRRFGTFERRSLVDQGVPLVLHVRPANAFAALCTAAP